MVFCKIQNFHYYLVNVIRKENDKELISVVDNHKRKFFPVKWISWWDFSSQIKLLTAKQSPTEEEVCP